MVETFFIMICLHFPEGYTTCRSISEDRYASAAECKVALHKYFPNGDERVKLDDGGGQEYFCAKKQFWESVD